MNNRCPNAFQKMHAFIRKSHEVDRDCAAEHPQSQADRFFDRSSASQVYQPSNAPSPSINNFEIEFPRLGELSLRGPNKQDLLPPQHKFSSSSIGLDTLHLSFSEALPNVTSFNATKHISLVLTVQLALPSEEVEGGKAFQGALAGVIIGTALSLGVSTVKASFVAGVTAAFVALVPILGGIDIEDELENEGDIPDIFFLLAGCQDIIHMPDMTERLKVASLNVHLVELWLNFRRHYEFNDFVLQIVQMQVCLE